MPQLEQIVANLADVSTIDSYAELQGEILEMFTWVSDYMKDWDDNRPSLIMRKMAATVDTIPYDMLAEFGHCYGAKLIAWVMIVHVVHADIPDYADAHDLLVTLVDELRGLDLDNPGAQEALERIEMVLGCKR